MVDIAKLAGSKREWVGDQQAYDYDDDEYNEFKTDGTLTGSNTVSNVLWKHAKLHETSVDEWIGTSDPGNLDLGKYNDALAYPTLFDFDNNTDDITLTQFAYKTGLIHADFKTNDFDPLEVKVNTNTTNVTNLRSDFTYMDQRNITSSRIIWENNVAEYPNLFKLTRNDSPTNIPFTPKHGTSFPSTRGEIEIEILNWDNFKTFIENKDEFGIILFMPAHNPIFFFGFDDTNNRQLFSWFGVSDKGFSDTLFYIQISKQSNTQIRAKFYSAFKRYDDYNIEWVDQTGTVSINFTSTKLKWKMQYRKGTTNTWYLIATDDIPLRIDKKFINNVVQTTEQKYNSDSENIALWDAISDNEDDITTNTGNISTNTTNISSNSTNIGTNTTNIGTNTTNITNNTTSIGTNSTHISSNASNITRNAGKITKLENNFKDMDVRNISTHRIEFTSNVYTIPNLIEITISTAIWSFNTKNSNDFPETQNQIKIKVLDWDNFYKWVDLVDHVGIHIETDKTSGAVGFGFAEIYDTNSLPDGSNWEYFAMTNAGTLPRSYLLHLSVQTASQINLFCYVPRAKVNDYNITYDKSTEYDAFSSTSLTKYVQFTNGTATNTKYTLVAYNDTIEKFDVIYQPTKTISHHALNSNADTIALAEKIGTNTTAIGLNTTFRTNDQSKVTELWTPVKTVLYSPSDFTSQWDSNENIDVRKVISWLPTNQHVASYKLELKNVNTTQPTFRVTVGSILGSGYRLMCDAEVDILSVTMVPDHVNQTSVNTNVRRVDILSDNGQLTCPFGLYAGLERKLLDWGSIQGYNFCAQSRVELKTRSCYHRIATTGSNDGDSIVYFEADTTICSDWMYKGSSPNWTTRVLHKVYAGPGYFYKDNNKYVLTPVIADYT